MTLVHTPQFASKSHARLRPVTTAAHLTRWARIVTLGVCLCALAGCVVEERVTVVDPAPPRHEVVYTKADFHRMLSPHGEWIQIPHHGLVWRPSVAVVGVGFVPYATGGQWVYTEYGWSFATDWEWGWGPFHYGHWHFDIEYGWVWIPGTIWAPAWVVWRTGGGFIGWAPMPPPGFVIVETCWVFVERHHFVRRHPSAHAIPRERVHMAFEVTAPVGEVIVHGSTRWPAGPRVVDVEEATGTRILPVRVVPPARGVVRPVRVTPPDRGAVRTAPVPQYAPVPRPAPVRRTSPTPARRPPAPVPQSRPKTRTPPPVTPAPRREN